jgi:hypothetical protein
VGVILGIAAGAAPAFPVIAYQYAHRNDDPSGSDLVQPLLIHIALWVGLGGAAGFSLALGRCGLRLVALIMGTLGGLFGAAVGSLVYELVGAMHFPHDWTVYPISLSPTTRLIARLSVALLTAIGAVLALGAHPERPESEPAKPTPRD